jgi:pyruvate dehydrogenase E2 component (dihydrolipoamide acetyltransferase)
MEFEAVDEGVVTSISVAEGTEGVKVGTVIALIQGEDEDAAPAPKAAPVPEKTEVAPQVTPAPAMAQQVQVQPGVQSKGERVIASPLAKRIAADRDVDLAGLSGTGPGGRIVKADVEAAAAGGSLSVAAPDSAPTGGPLISPLAQRLAEQMGVDVTKLVGTGPGGRIVKTDVEGAASGAPAPVAAPSTPVSAPAPSDGSIPHEVVKLSGMRKTIARRLSQSMQEAPHIYLTVDIRLDALLQLRGELNETLAKRGVKLSVNDMLIKALGLALMEVPACNVSFAGDTMVQYSRADVSVAVSIPGGLITPIIVDAANKSLATITTEMNDLGARAKAGKLAPHEYQGGTASISNMGMMGIKQFTAVINPPQAMIMAVGAGEKRPYAVDDALGVATVMSCTGSFDHRAIDGADGAMLMAAFKGLVEKPLGLVV